MSLDTIDLVIVGLYAVALFAIAIFVSREPAGETKDTEDYFLAGKALPWWAIGASLIAANISAEQIIGQSGQGFVVGLAIAAYEWQAALVLIIVAAFFLPIFLKRGIYTMPQFLETRFGPSVKTIMAVFWIFPVHGGEPDNGPLWRCACDPGRYRAWGVYRHGHAGRFCLALLALWRPESRCAD